MRALFCAALIAMTLSAASSRLQAQDIDAGEGPLVLTADRIVHEGATGIVRAVGNVEISRGARRVLADEVVYDPNGDRVSAIGNVTLLEPTGEAFFGDEMQLTGDLGDGFIEQIRVLLSDDSRIAAARAVRREGRYTEFEKAVFSPCELCEDEDGEPLWQITAAHVEHDQESRDVTYYNAFLEFYGVPIAYTPYLTHPDPGVKRRTGLLTPQIGIDSELGFTLATPYFIDLAPNRDITVTPLFTSQEGTLLGVEYRELRNFGRTELFLSATDTSAAEKGNNSSSDGDGDEVRWNAEGTGRYVVGRDWGAGFDLNVASDDTYRKRYGFGNESILLNRAYVERTTGRDYYGVNSFAFQGLRRRDDQDTIPLVLPLAESHIETDPDPDQWGSRWTLDSNLLALHRNKGLNTRRVSVEGGWQVPYVSGMGDITKLTLALRGDGYSTDGDPKTLGQSNDESTAGRIVPRVTVDWRWPFVSDQVPFVDAASGWRQTLEPLVSATWTPDGGNSSSIPNEDSIDLEFDDTNLFEVNKHPGLDRVDEGGRVNYGLRFGAHSADNRHISALVGQAYYVSNNPEFTKDSGLGENLSDYVGRLQLQPHEIFDLNYRFRADRSSLELKLSDLTARFEPGPFRFDLGYLQVANEEIADNEGFKRRKELTAGIRVRLNEEWSVSARTRQDLSENRKIVTTYGVVYDNPCLVLVAGIKDDNTEDRDAGSGMTFTLRITLKQLGEINTGSAATF